MLAVIEELLSGEPHYETVVDVIEKIQHLTSHNLTEFLRHTDIAPMLGERSAPPG